MNLQAPREKRLYRSRRERMIAGVCGGLAEYFGVDPTAVRVAWVILSIVPGTIIGGIIVYVALWLIVPEEAVAASAPPPGPAPSLDNAPPTLPGRAPPPQNPPPPGA